MKLAARAATAGLVLIVVAVVDGAPSAEVSRRRPLSLPGAQSQPLPPPSPAASPAREQPAFNRPHRLDTTSTCHVQPQSMLSSLPSGQAADAIITDCWGRKHSLWPWPHPAASPVDERRNLGYPRGAARARAAARRLDWPGR